MASSEDNNQNLNVEKWLKDNKENIIVKAEITDPKTDSKDGLKSVLKLNNLKTERSGGCSPVPVKLSTSHGIKNEPDLIGATCQNYFSDEDAAEQGDSSLIVLSSDLDESSLKVTDEIDASEDSLLSVGDDVMLVPETPSPAVKQEIKMKKEPEPWKKKLDFESQLKYDDDFDDEISFLTNELQKLPLPGRITTPIATQPNPSPAAGQSQSSWPKDYDPTALKHESFYGDVSRTVVKLAEIIETMPTPGDKEEDAPADDECQYGLQVPLYDHQLYGVKWLVWREGVFPGGGILADEMGLGKTIMMIALIMKTKLEGAGNQGEQPKRDDKLLPSRATLVVCPAGCLFQWEAELRSKGEDLQILMFHGVNRNARTNKKLMSRFDVVLTTYETIAAEIPKDGGFTFFSSAIRLKSHLAQILWHRIVLDEAHKIRNPKTNCAVAICSLAACHRWAVTGTPVHNYPEDFFSICKFLQLKPFDEPKVWNYWIGKKSVKGGAQTRLHTIGKALLLRRTKEEVTLMGGNVRDIPPKVVEIVEVDLSQAERSVYDHLMLFAQTMFAKFMRNKKEKEEWRDGAAPTDIRFSHMFAVICRLRQCAVLPYLIATALEEEDVDDNDSFDEFNEEHLISKRNPIFDRLYESSKIKKILEDLESLRETALLEERPMDKVVIVSHWTTLLDILYEHLRARGFSSVFITGDLNIADRQMAMEKFNTKPKKPQILLLSLGAGGVGINLVGGNHVFFVEPSWNPQNELQAQDRVHRFGQKKNVFIRRYISKETLESHVLELADLKVDLADGVLNSTKKSRGHGLTIQQMKLMFGV
ncbi:unnamed protein product [Orchesella dallaii]|uniref:Transcription termination factor 2 n=1 Tax=Orchesella dallaii TaxID=48710 RepID=A0ABP1RBM0_9HEXA